MLPKEILKKVRHIELKTRNLVNDVFSGEYHSVFKGMGMEFSEVREYQFGDDIRKIDWNVTARSNKPFVKVYEEERELTVMLVVDASGSGQFGTGEKFKSEIAAEICALLAFSAIKNNDKVGLLIFTDDIEKYIPPAKGRSHVLRVIREILYFQPKSKRTNIKQGLEYLLRGLKRHTIVFLVSDFDDTEYMKPLKILNKKHDVIAIQTYDQREITLPNVGLIKLQDSETGEELWVDTSRAKFRNRYTSYMQDKFSKLQAEAKRIKLGHVLINVSESYIDPLIKFFKYRERLFR